MMVKVGEQDEKRLQQQELLRSPAQAGMVREMEKEVEGGGKMLVPVACSPVLPGKLCSPLPVPGRNCHHFTSRQPACGPDARIGGDLTVMEVASGAELKRWRGEAHVHACL